MKSPLYAIALTTFAVLLGALIVHLYTAQESIEQQPTTEEVWLDVGAFETAEGAQRELERLDAFDAEVPTCIWCGEVARDLQEGSDADL